MIDEKKVIELFDDAKIAYNEAELKQMTNKLGIMVSLADKLNGFVCDKDEFTAPAKTTEELRGDTIKESMNKSVLISQANAHNTDFCVPSIMSAEVSYES